MAHRDIQVHDFTGWKPRDVYDRTQTDDAIKDGDVLNLGNGNVAILVKAWPTIVVGDIEQFHRLKAGTSFETLRQRQIRSFCRKGGGKHRFAFAPPAMRMTSRVNSRTSSAMLL